jgi:tetratricopeptide (TPR) repeat protein
VLPAAARHVAEQKLAAAAQAFQQDPSLENTIWYGRRAAYLFHYAQAIAIYSDGIARFPNAHELYRHRGHRYISTRQFAAAIADLERAAALAADKPVTIEADGMPNARNQPTSNSHFNIWYHLGLAYYLTGAFAQAAQAYATCLTYSDNDDSIVATVDWYYMTLRHLGEGAAAARLLDKIQPEMDLIESADYHKRLLLYKGLVTPEMLLPPLDAEAQHEDAVSLATQGYGVANWYRANGDHATATAIFTRVLQSANWSAFGYIAAEVALAAERDAPHP